MRPYLPAHLELEVEGRALKGSGGSSAVGEQDLQSFAEMSWLEANCAFWNADEGRNHGLISSLRKKRVCLLKTGEKQVIQSYLGSENDMRNIAQRPEVPQVGPRRWPDCPNDSDRSALGIQAASCLQIPVAEV